MHVHVKLHTCMHSIAGLMIRIAKYWFWEPEISAVLSGGMRTECQPCTLIDIVYIHIEPGGAYV